MLKWLLHLNLCIADWFHGKCVGITKKMYETKGNSLVETL